MVNIGLNELQSIQPVIDYILNLPELVMLLGVVIVSYLIRILNLFNSIYWVSRLLR
ncbi:MAG: hypothetical protein J07HQW2_00251 [Haloquadratum walsbyi J07HQW2]|uniref:Uncharacterized protein n=1 Tax=Haloquadratum walsbyi J07HQW2 TaxID=1238425 RepID=U1PJI0_9EURY|nr:MAG: hypothetical protein J07HQW2_00251 [Haloquadratum walsbyi J07HQW2]